MLAVDGARRLAAAVVAAVMSLTACTASQPDRAAERPPSTGPTVAGLAGEERAAPEIAPAPGCSAPRSTDIDSNMRARSPEAALSMHGKNPAEFEPTVGRRVEFYADDGSASIVVERHRRRWTVAAINEPSCPPRALRLAARTSETNLDCKGVAHGYIYKRAYVAPTATAAVYDELRMSPAFRRTMPKTGYVRLGRDDGRIIFGHFDGRKLTATMQVWHPGDDGFGVESAEWC